jgi:hypothetical protein
MRAVSRVQGRQRGRPRSWRPHSRDPSDPPRDHESVRAVVAIRLVAKCKRGLEPGSGCSRPAVFRAEERNIALLVYDTFGVITPCSRGVRITCQIADR